jgi:hypothetical protein
MTGVPGCFQFSASEFSALNRSPMFRAEKRSSLFKSIVVARGNARMPVFRDQSRNTGILAEERLKSLRDFSILWLNIDSFLIARFILIVSITRS